MLEITFSDSLAGSLRVAQHSRRPVRWMDLSCAPGDPPPPPRRERPAPEEVLEGDAADIVPLCLSLDLGPLEEPESGLVRRRALLAAMCSDFAPKDFPFWERVEASLRRLQEVRAQGTPLRVWLCPDSPDELCGLLWLCRFLEDGAAPVSVVSLPRTGETRRGVFQRLRGSGDWPPERLGAMAKTARPLDEAERLACVTLWRRLSAENAPLRAVVNGDLMSVPEDFYDFALRACVPERTFRLGTLLGDALTRLPGAGDWWLCQRVKAMVEAGELTEVAPPSGEHPYSGWLRRTGLGPEPPEERAERRRPLPERTVYVDAGALQGGVIMVSSDTERVTVVHAGTTWSPAPPSDRALPEYQAVLDGGLSLLFLDGEKPRPDFYAVPRLDLFAATEDGGWLGVLSAGGGDGIICYVNREGRAFRAADSRRAFMEALFARKPWRNALTPCGEVRLYPSRQAAEAELEFVVLEPPEEP